MNEHLTAKQFQVSSGAGDWRVLAGGASAWFEAPSHKAGAALVRRVAEMTADAGRFPDADLRAGGIHVRIGTPGSQGFTGDDVALAGAISAAASDLGLTADPTAVQTLQLAIDATDTSAVLPFWHTALGYEQLGNNDLVDMMRRDPPIWFQQMDRPRPLRNRIHVDIARPRGLVLEWAEAVESVGGRYIGGAYNVGYADAEGNEADIVPDDALGNGSETTDWRVLFGAMTYYPTAAPLQAAELAAEVAALADDAGMPILIDLRPSGVTVETGKDQWEDEPRFSDLARRIQAAAGEMGLTADPARLRFVQIGIDAVDVSKVREFWRAVLGYAYDPRPFVTDIYDPRRLNLPIFFQQMSADETSRREQRNRIHIDVFVPDDQAQARIDTALAAGGQIVYDAEAPEWWTIADPEGNEVDIAVSGAREELRL